jgi:5-methylcytosine-specific restriction endonuclease McrA
MGTAEQASAAAAAEWDQSLMDLRLANAWRAANPEDKCGPDREWFQQQGLPYWGDPGMLQVGSLPRTDKRWWYIRLRQPTEWGTHVIECRQCGQLALRHDHRASAGLCHDCRNTDLEQRKVVKAERRIERRQQRSAELANRQGLCRVCGSQMTVARISKVTCSDRCRKQWIRNGEQAFPLPEAPTEVRIGAVDPLPLAVAHERVFDRLMRHTMTREIKWGEPDPVADDMRRILDQIIHLRSLAALRESAPAVFLFEMSQLNTAAPPDH